MDAFSVPAVFMAKPGLLGRLFGRNRQGSLSLQPDGTFTMTGYDKVYTADDVYEVRAWETGFIDIEMQEDEQGFHRFAVYHEEAYKFYAWLIRQNVRRFGMDMLREDDDLFRKVLDEPVMEVLSKWHRQDEAENHLPEDDLAWEEVDADFRKWICAVGAINRKANGWHVEEFGGYSKHDPLGQEFGRQVLRRSWEINSRAELIETIQDMVGQKLLWQLLRTVQNAGFGYLAGYLTLREALNVALTAGRRLQKVTRSWDGMGRAYLRSYRDYMSAGDDYTLRANAFLELQTDENSIYKAVPFDLELVKTW